MRRIAAAVLAGSRMSAFDPGGTIADDPSGSYSLDERLQLDPAEFTLIAEHQEEISATTQHSRPKLGVYCSCELSTKHSARSADWCQPGNYHRHVCINS